MVENTPKETTKSATMMSAILFAAFFISKPPCKSFVNFNSNIGKKFYMLISLEEKFEINLVFSVSQN